MYGFINHIGTRIDYFVHDDNLIDKVKTGDNVEFELGSGPKGLIAINVKLLKDK
jgi:cold shock CspA family protein